MRARTQAANQLHALVVTAPEKLREHLRPLFLRKLVATVAAFRPGASLTSPMAATKLALRCLARRYQHLSAEMEAIDLQLTRLLAHVAPALLAVKGVGTDTAAVLLATAGDYPDRVRSEAAFAHRCGAAPLPASSGKTTRFRLDRGGNRDANRVVHLLAVRRMAWDPRTRADVTRRTAEGKTTPEIRRCLKR
jgi:transposase